MKLPVNSLDQWSSTLDLSKETYVCKHLFQEVRLSGVQILTWFQQVRTEVTTQHAQTGKDLQITGIPRTGIAFLKNTEAESGHQQVLQGTWVEWMANEPSDLWFSVYPVLCSGVLDEVCCAWLPYECQGSRLSPGSWTIGTLSTEKLIRLLSLNLYFCPFSQ